MNVPEGSWPLAEAELWQESTCSCVPALFCETMHWWVTILVPVLLHLLSLQNASSPGRSGSLWLELAAGALGLLITGLLLALVLKVGDCVVVRSEAART